MLLLAAGAEVDAQDQDGWTALCYACENSHAEVVSELLQRGARVDIATSDGWTPLHMACVEGSDDVFIELFGGLDQSGDALNMTTPEV